jgi:hypothetical protein
VAAACAELAASDVAPATSDAGNLTPPDATTDTAAAADGGDAQIEAGPAPPATITVADYNGPMTGVAVFFHDATGKLLETKSTGSDGKVARVVDPAGTETVTVAVNRPGITVSNGAAYTIFGVRPGDEIPISFIELARNTRVNAPQTAFAGATEYRSACNPIAPSVTDPAVFASDLFGDCRGVSTYPFVVIALPGAAHPLAYTFKKGLAYSPSATAPLTSFPDWITDVGTTRLTARNRPPTTTPETPLGLFHMVHGVRFLMPDTPEGPEGDQSFATLPSVADAYVAVAAVTETGAIGIGRYSRLLARRMVAAPAAVDLDLATLAPPLTNLTITGRLPNATIKWFGGPTAAKGDAVAIHVEWGPRNCAWTFLTRPGSTSLASPSIPLTSFPCLNDAFAARFAVLAIDSDALTSYEEAKQYISALAPRDIYVGPVRNVPALPLVGTYRLSVAIDR